MELHEILHGGDECTMNKTIVASHSCLGDHYLITWDFHKLFELWWKSPDLGFEFLESHEYVGPGLGMTYDDATIIAEDFFNDWLEALPGEE